MKDYDKTTVAGVANFPVQDITHKPKRHQGDLIRLKQLEEQGVEQDQCHAAGHERVGTFTVEFYFLAQLAEFFSHITGFAFFLKYIFYGTKVRRIIGNRKQKVEK